MLSKAHSSGRQADLWACCVPDESAPYAAKSAQPKHPLSKGRPAPAHALDDDGLVRLAQKDDGDAAAELIRRYQRKVYRIAFHIASGDKEEAKDLTQETFFRVFQNIQKFDGRSSFYTWLYRVAVNTCLGQRRKNLRWARILFPGRSKRAEESGRSNELENHPAPDEESNPALAYRGQRLEEDVKGLLHSLPTKQRLVFQLKVMDEMSIREIAAVTGMAEGTIKSHLSRATRKARDRLRQWRKE